MTTDTKKLTWAMFSDEGNDLMTEILRAIYSAPRTIAHWDFEHPAVAFSRIAKQVAPEQFARLEADHSEWHDTAVRDEYGWLFQLPTIQALNHLGLAPSDEVEAR